MTDLQLYKEIESLPADLKKQVRDFMEFLIEKTKSTKRKKPEAVFGYLKGKITMSPDFDEPLEEFKEYME